MSRRGPTLRASKPRSSVSKATTKAEIQRLEARIDLVENRLVVRLGSMIAAAAGILIAIHYIH
jgi:uracil-DNA glycosylase